MSRITLKNYRELRHPEDQDLDLFLAKKHVRKSTDSLIGCQAMAYSLYLKEKDVNNNERVADMKRREEFLKKLTN